MGLNSEPGPGDIPTLLRLLDESERRNAANRPKLDTLIDQITRIYELRGIDVPEPILERLVELAFREVEGQAAAELAVMQATESEIDRALKALETVTKSLTTPALVNAPPVAKSAKPRLPDVLAKNGAREPTPAPERQSPTERVRPLIEQYLAGAPRPQTSAEVAHGIHEPVDTVRWVLGEMVRQQRATKHAIPFMPGRGTRQPAPGTNTMMVYNLIPREVEAE